ncbi:MAG: LPS export ABC transporter permease LptF [Burkholderiaceae bacterium]|nr:LPS export ABC transporter permease LptF [Burkholderiaceae bacterium]
MLLRTTLRRELGNHAGIVFATLFTIMVTTTLIRLLGNAASGNVDTASVLPMIAFASINYLPNLLVLTLYVSTLMAFTRAWRDSEMVIWQASGLGLTAWIRPVLGFSMPLVILVGLIAMALAPWANAQRDEYQRRFNEREDVSQLAAGQFRESTGANRVFFIESLNEDQTEVRNVFVAQQRGDRLTVVASEGGRIETRPDGERFLVLMNGRRYDAGADGGDFRLMEFEGYGVRIERRRSATAVPPAKAKGTLDLVRDPTTRNLAELLWRIGLPVSALLLPLLAIPLASVNPRMGRSINLVVAMLVYVVYSNLLSLMQGWVVQQRISFGLAVWIIHAGLLVLIVFLFQRKTSMPLGRWWRRLPRPGVSRQRAREARA